MRVPGSACCQKASKYKTHRNKSANKGNAKATLLSLGGGREKKRVKERKEEGGRRKEGRKENPPMETQLY